MKLLLFQNNLPEDQYTFAYAQAQFRSTFRLRLRYLQNMDFKRFTADSGIENSWPNSFFLIWLNKKMSLGVNQGCTVDEPSFQHVECSNIPLSLWKIISCCFPYFFKHSWQADSIDLLRSNKGTVPPWPIIPKNNAVICFDVLRSFASLCHHDQNNAIICFGVLLPHTNCVGFAKSSKSHMVDCCFVLGSHA